MEIEYLSVVIRNYHFGKVEMKTSEEGRYSTPPTCRDIFLKILHHKDYFRKSSILLPGYEPPFTQIWRTALRMDSALSASPIRICIRHTTVILQEQQKVCTYKLQQHR